MSMKKKPTTEEITVVIKAFVPPMFPTQKRIMQKLLWTAAFERLNESLENATIEIEKLRNDNLDR